MVLRMCMENAWRVTYQQAGPSVQMMRVFFVWAADDMPLKPAAAGTPFMMSANGPSIVAGETDILQSLLSPSDESLDACVAA